MDRFPVAASGDVSNGKDICQALEVCWSGGKRTPETTPGKAKACDNQCHNQCESTERLIATVRLQSTAL